MMVPRFQKVRKCMLREVGVFLGFFFFIGENKNCKEQRSNVGAWRVKLGNFLGIVL